MTIKYCKDVPNCGMGYYPEDGHVCGYCYVPIPDEEFTDSKYHIRPTGYVPPQDKPVYADLTAKDKDDLLKKLSQDAGLVK